MFDLEVVQQCLVLRGENVCDVSRPKRKNHVSLKIRLAPRVIRYDGIISPVCVRAVTVIFVIQSAPCNSLI